MLCACAGEVEEGQDIFAEGRARPVGKVLVVGSDAAVAMLRLEAAFSETSLRAGSATGPKVKVLRPSWWPPQWGHEEQEQ